MVVLGEQVRQEEAHSAHSGQERLAGRGILQFRFNLLVLQSLMISNLQIMEQSQAEVAAEVVAAGGMMSLLWFETLLADIITYNIKTNGSLMLVA
jgi:hypothetical protein